MVVERRDEDRRHALDRLASLERAQRAPAPQLTRIDLHFVLWNTYGTFPVWPIGTIESSNVIAQVYVGSD